MSRNVVGWFEIYVQDMPRAKAFYEAVFQIKLENAPPNPTFPDMEMAFFAMDTEHYGASGALVRMPKHDASGGDRTVVYFHCQDCAVEAARSTQLGGSLYKAKLSIGEHGYIALIKDTEGNMIGLHSMQ